MGEYLLTGYTLSWTRRLSNGIGTKGYPVGGLVLMRWLTQKDDIY